MSTVTQKRSLSAIKAIDPVVPKRVCLNKPKSKEPCKECGTKTHRHFFLDEEYKFSLCTKCRYGCGKDDFEINITYMKKACVHFKRLWSIVLKKEGIKLSKLENISKLYNKDSFCRPVARFENYMDLDKIRDHILDIWEEKIVPLFEKYPTLKQYDPVGTFAHCVEYALSRKKLKSKFMEEYTKNTRNPWYDWCNMYYGPDFYRDFDFHTYENK